MVVQSIATAVMRQLPTCSTVPFVVHSTFRDYDGFLLRPTGLEWGMYGDSHLAYLPANADQQAVNLDEPQVRKGIVEAHNRWCFAKSLEFKHVNDILSLSRSNGHIVVEWKDTPRSIETETRHQDIVNLIENDDSAQINGPQAEVWVNGEFISVLDGPDTLDPVLEALSRIKSVKVSLKRSDGLIRVERYFMGGLRDRQQVFDHIMDNLIALEDPQIIDEQILIGTATLPDWIMGGNLTSRLWIQELPNQNILFLRPLRNDDINTSDRKFELIKGQDDEKVQQVQKELKRLRMLAFVKHPFVEPDPDSISSDPMSEVKRKLGLNRKHRKVFRL